MNNITLQKKYIDLVKYFSDNNINIKSSLSDNESISGISSLEKANKNQISFFENTKFINYLKNTNAKACFIRNEYVDLLPNSCLPIIVDNPYLCFAYTTNFFYPKRTSIGKISQNSSIHKNTSISNNIEVGNYVTIAENCSISKNVIIENNVIIERGVNIIACPSCARQGFDVIKAVEELESRLSHIKTPLNLSIIGCVVNGPGEALMTDLGYTGGGAGAGMVYVSGKQDRKIGNDEMIEHIVELVENKVAKLNKKKSIE